MGKNFSLLKEVKTDSGTHRTSYQISTEVSFFRKQSGRVVKLITNIYPVSRLLRMSESIIVGSVYAFMARRGAIVTCTVIN
jgi:hypothetical protein